MSADAKRERSHWGWGWADREPDRASLEALAPIVRERLGFGGDRIETPVALESIDVAPSRLRPPESLAAILSDAPPDRIRHSMGRAYRDVVRGFRGSTPPTTLVPPPNGIAASRRSAHSSRTRRTSSSPAGKATMSGVRSNRPRKPRTTSR